MIAIDLQEAAGKAKEIMLEQRRLQNAMSAGRKFVRLGQHLWAVEDNGIVTTINTRGAANPSGGISYTGNFVYGPAGTPQIQPDPVHDQWWRYGNDGYKVITGKSSGGNTLNYEVVNVGPMQSDGSDWGYEPEPATPTYDYFAATNYPGSAAYNYPGYPVTNAAAKEAYIQSNGEGVVHLDGSVGTDHVKDDEFNFGTSEVW
eukprot:CAMPEP_0196752996 /NCGR_PEP_ID=MMETSP1091-20130531/89130_1 /TAXON_ID=302021 /ORGANISM="Rhodomonas sp., Strain CCMP768" /LENGTH=201 /DNA_ID=CAMNT_0042101035 /DNA_START=81 /DNA_END=686 /DNA_ORIENTATION=+